MHVCLFVCLFRWVSKIWLAYESWLVWCCAAEKIIHQTAYVGQTAKLPCRTTVSFYVDWRRLANLTSHHTYIYTNGIVWEEFRPRFTVDITKDDNGEVYTLAIADVQFNDSALYLCVENGGLGNRHFFELNVTGTHKELNTSDILLREHLREGFKRDWGGYTAKKRDTFYH